MAESDGIAEKTLKRAKNALHVRSYNKKDAGDKTIWFWHTPQAVLEPDNEEGREASEASLW